MDRGKRRFLKTMMSNVLDRQKWFENATCGRGFSRKRRRKSPFSKISGYVWTGKNDLKKLRVDANIFENGRKKSFVFKNIRICVDGALVEVHNQ